MNIPFTFDGYRTLVGSLLTQGDEVRSFVDVEPNMRHLVLRHDVDQSLQSAARLASLESEAGWRASYFVLLRSEMYNPFAPASVAALEGIIEGGHEIGLHLDSALYDGAFEAIEEGAARECALLESLLGRPVETISFHRPRAGVGAVRPDVGGPAEQLRKPVYRRDRLLLGFARGAGIVIIRLRIPLWLRVGRCSC